NISGASGWRPIGTFPASLMAGNGWFNGRSGEAREWLEVQGLQSVPPGMVGAGFYNTLISAYTAAWFGYPSPDPTFCIPTVGNVQTITPLLWTTSNAPSSSSHNESPYDQHWPNAA